MAHLLVRHRVQDFEKWKAVYDEHGATRKAAGSTGTQVFRNADEPNEAVVLLEWDYLNNALSFAGSEGLRDTMQRAGVTGPPDVRFIDRVDTSDA